MQSAGTRHGTQPKGRVQTVSQHLARHLSWCRERNLRPSYIETRRRTIINTGMLLGKHVEDATESEITWWYSNLTDRVSPEARAVALSHVQCYFRWLYREGFVQEDITVRLVRPRTRRRLPRPISDDRLSAALETANPRARIWLMLACFQGLRAIEIANLRAEDVDLQQNLLLVADGKGGKQRLLPLHPEVAGALEPILPARGFVFAHWDRPGPPRPWNVSHAMNQALRNAGYPDTAHSLRHWFLTRVYAASNDLRLTQELAGHSNPQTTAGYAAWSQEKARPVVEGLRL